MSGKKISSRTRFLVLKRDGFRCLYCGRSAGDVELHVDHVEAQSKGGPDDLSNFVSSCATCNIGKGAENLFASAHRHPHSPGAAPALVGKCFVVFGSYNRVDLSGIIRGKVGDSAYLVQYFDALAGQPSTLAVVDVEKMLAKPLSAREAGEWEFFEDIEHLSDWLDHTYRDPK